MRKTEASEAADEGIEDKWGRTQEAKEEEIAKIRLIAGRGEETKNPHSR